MCILIGFTGLESYVKAFKYTICQGDRNNFVDH